MNSRLSSQNMADAKIIGIALIMFRIENEHYTGLFLIWTPVKTGAWFSTSLERPFDIVYLILTRRVGGRAVRQPNIFKFPS